MQLHKKYLFKNAVDSQDGLLKILLDQLEEEDVVVNFGDGNESPYKFVKDLNNSKNPIISYKKGEGTVSVTLDSSFS